MPRLSFDPIGDSWTLVAALLAALVVGLFCLRPKEPGTSTSRRRAEFVIRLTVVLLFAVLFARPSVVSEEKEELPASIAFLCDLSESMSIRDAGENASRYEALQKAFDDASGPFRALCEKFDVHVYGFGDSLEELDVEDGKILFPQTPTGSETKIGDALTEIARATAGKRLVGAAILSDGAQRAKIPEDAVPTQDAALRLRDAERPVYAVPFGSADASATARDVAVLDLRANDHVFLGNELTVSGQVRLLGCANLNVPLTLALETESGKMETVAQTTLAPTSADATIPYQFTCRPETPGEWKLSVAAAVQQDELVETNNELSAFVEAIDRGVDALYIEGTRRYEQNFLRAALETASDVRVRYWRPPTTSMVAKSPDMTEAEMVAEYTRSRKPLDKTFFSEGKFAVYVLGDVDASAFQPNELKELARRVEEGAGLVVLAGERSLSLGGYAETPLANALPVQTSVADRLSLDVDLASLDAGSDETQRMRVFGAFRALPTPSRGRDAYIVQLSLDAKKNQEIWRGMPDLSTIYRLGRLKPNARVLLNAAPVNASGTPDEKATPTPLLVAQQYGEGRVVVLATDSTWRWRMRGAESEHAKFWRQLLLWSAKFDELLEGELAVELDRSRFATDEPVEFRAQYRPKPDEDPTGLKVRATIVGPNGGRERVDMNDENGVWKGLGKNTGEPGDYVVEAELLSPTGAVLQSAQARFLVFSQNIELERPEANRATLENLALAAGGKTVEPEEFAAFIDELLQQRETIVDVREVKKSLYDVWPIFWAFVALMTFDWILRKRWGMV
ncbi:MAG: VWA domain-containing protein [Thermoguttaceae bacterium]|nr:VWA domain-containing protein [Thermoguttaceae bacterium]